MFFNRTLFLLGFSLFGLTAAYSQKGYVMIDSAYSTGFVENQGRNLNTRQLKFRKSLSSPVIVYEPTTATEFGFNDQVYRSRKISTGADSTAYFLYVLSKGDVYLYAVKVNGKKRFFAESDQEFVELKPENKQFRQDMQRLLNKCEQYKNYLPSLKLREKALKRFFALQNRCYNQGPWPTTRLSAFAGFAPRHLTIINAYGDKVNLGTDTSPFFGFGIEMPVGTRPNWSVLIQATYQQNNYRTSIFERGEFEQRDADYDINISTLAIPALVKYSVSVKNARTYVTLGPACGYNLKTDSFVKEKIIRNSGIIDNEDSSDLVKKVHVNINAGIGIEYYIRANLSLGIEGRYSAGQGLGTDSHSISATQVAVLVNF